MRNLLPWAGISGDDPGCLDCRCGSIEEDGRWWARFAAAVARNSVAFRLRKPSSSTCLSAILDMLVSAALTSCFDAKV